MRRVREVTNIDNPDKNADDSNDLGEHITEVVKFAFQRCLLCNLGRDRLVNVADRGVLTCADNNSASSSIYDSCSLM